LQDHQLTGLNWLAYSWHNKNNVILADEMGLGKTIQTISLFSYLIHSKGITRPFLVVAPLSTIKNWERELEKWLPDACVIVFQGDKTSREVIKSQELCFGAPIPKTMPRFNVMLTTYEMLMIEQKTLGRINWRMIVIDEGQKLKNNKSKIFHTTMNMKSDFRMLLTGTPLQNNIDELLNLLHFISPEKFNDSVNEELKKKFYDSLKDQLADKSLIEEEKLVPNNEFEGNTVVPSIQALLQPHLLRRLKADVLVGFVLKKEVIVPVELTERQRMIYKCIFKKNFEALTFLDRNNKSSNKVSLKSANNVLLYLRF
jgi:SNF2 family DNA or RNA helicase